MYCLKKNKDMKEEVNKNIQHENIPSRLTSMLFDCLFTTFDGSGCIRSGEPCGRFDPGCCGFIGPKLLAFRLPSTPASGSDDGSSFLICIPNLLELELFPLPDVFNSSLFSTGCVGKRNKNVDY